MSDKNQKSDLFKSKDGKIYKVSDLVLAIATLMSREGYTQPFCVFLDIGFHHNKELLDNAYHHFFVENANKFTNSVPYEELEEGEGDKLDQWICKHGNGVEV